jgi:hypothetical protein
VTNETYLRFTTKFRRVDEIAFRLHPTRKTAGILTQHNVFEQ